jgi:cyclase
LAPTGVIVINVQIQSSHINPSGEVFNMITTVQIIGAKSVQALIAVFLMLPLVTFAQNDVTTEKVTDNIFLISGKGGNIGVFIGDDGTFMIDDKFADMSEGVFNAIESIGGSQPEYLINTHFHGDHTGGNDNFGKEGSTIVSHHNVHKRLAEGSIIAAFGMETPPAPDTALPGITFDSEMIMHINGDHIRIFHAPNAHTDGDAIVHFQTANVIHTGDLFFNGFYPFIDVGNGGSVQGLINGIDQVLQLADDDTKIIPGHGALAGVGALKAYKDMLVTAHTRLSAMKAEGKSAEEMIAESPLADFEAQWGNGIFTGDKWISIIYDGL